MKVTQALVAAHDLLVQARASAGSLSWAGGVACGIVAGGTLVVLAAEEGGYFPVTWGWTALTFSWLAAVALALRSRTRLSRAELVFVATLVALVGWILASAVWALSAPRVVPEAERALVYVSAVLALVATARRSWLPHLLGGVSAGISVLAAYALATKLFPDRLGVDLGPEPDYRLSAPLSYPGALGILPAIGAIIALGLAVHAKSRLAQAYFGASLVVLVTALYFTFSRGAAAALAAGVLALVVLDARRLRVMTTLVTVGWCPAVAVALASRADALTELPPPPAAESEGRQLAAWLALLAGAAALAAFATTVAAERIRVSARGRIAYAGLLVAVGCLVLTGAFIRYGAPHTVAERALRSFTSPPDTASADPNRRFLTLSGNRYYYWKAAWLNYKEHPWLGSGAGSYELHWTQHRLVNEDVRDAHGLYVETLTELGPLGIGLLLFALGIPLFAAARARGNALVPAAFGGYVAYLIHAGVDWDWETPVITLAGLCCGAALLVAARTRENTRFTSGRVRVALLGVTLVVGLSAFVGLVGNRALARGNEALTTRNFSEDETEADTAAQWAPWSPEPERLLGEVQLVTGNLAAARASFREAIAKDDRDSELWFGLARASTGDAQRRALARALELNPRSSEFLVFQRYELSPRREP